MIAAVVIGLSIVTSTPAPYATGGSANLNLRSNGGECITSPYLLNLASQVQSDPRFVRVANGLPFVISFGYNGSETIVSNYEATTRIINDTVIVFNYYGTQVVTNPSCPPSIWPRWS